MSLHNKPEFNSPEIRDLLLAHGFDPDKPSLTADAFRMGFTAAQPDYKVSRCENCTCDVGGAQCHAIKMTPRNGKRDKDMDHA
jgi:hypothetical protein